MNIQIAQQDSNQSNAKKETQQTFSMSPKAQDLAEECVTRKSLLIALSENECFSDAIMLLSYAMPHQKGLQWALKCIHRDTQTQETLDTLQAAEKWLVEPTETNREKILPSNIVEQPSAATWLAMATYWSGGSIADTTIVEDELTEATAASSAPNGLVNDTIYSSVMLSVQELKTEGQHNAYNDAINQGIKLLYT